MTGPARPSVARRPVAPLARGMGVFGVLFLTLSCATPASSVFVILPGVIQAAGSGALISMLAAGVVAVCMAMTYAELGSTFPSAGGEYAIVGRVLGPTAAFAMLGVNGLNLLLGAAVLAMGVSDYLRALWPALPAVPTALAAIALATGLGLVNIRSSAAITGAFLAVEFVALLGVTIFGFAHPARGIPELIAHPVMAAPGGALAAVGLGGLASGVVVGLFAYDGYGSAIYLSEEVIDVRRRLVQAVVWALASTAVMELAALCAVLVGAPDLKVLFAAGDEMISAFANQAAGPVLGKAISAGVALSILNAVIAVVLMGARQLFASARDGAFPGVGDALTAVHPRFGSPWVSTLVVGAIGAGLCFIPLSALLTLSGSTVIFIYAGLSTATLLHGRAKRKAAPGWRMPLWPAPPALTLVMLAVIAVAGLKDGWVSFAVSLAAAGLAALHYRLILKPRDTWTPRGPELDAP